MTIYSRNSDIPEQLYVGTAEAEHVEMLIESNVVYIRKWSGVKS